MPLAHDTPPISRSGILPIAAVSLFFACTATAQTKPDSLRSTEAVILQLEQDRVRALISGDYTAQKGLMAPECVHIESNGIERTTTEYIASLKVGPWSGCTARAVSNAFPIRAQIITYLIKPTA